MQTLKLPKVKPKFKIRKRLAAFQGIQGPLLLLKICENDNMWSYLNITKEINVTSKNITNKYNVIVVSSETELP